MKLVLPEIFAHGKHTASIGDDFFFCKVFGRGQYVDEVIIYQRNYRQVTEDGRTNNNQTMNVIHCVTGARSGRAETKKTKARTKTNCKQRITDFCGWLRLLT